MTCVVIFDARFSRLLVKSIFLTLRLLNARLMIKVQGTNIKLNNSHHRFRFVSRSLHRTMSQITQLSSIPTLSDLYKSSRLQAPPPDSANPAPSSALNSKVSLIQTSITTLGVTSIVNAANYSLLGGAGVVSLSFSKNKIKEKHSGTANLQLTPLFLHRTAPSTPPPAPNSSPNAEP